MVDIYYTMWYNNNMSIIDFPTAQVRRQRNQTASNETLDLRTRKLLEAIDDLYAKIEELEIKVHNRDKLITQMLKKEGELPK